ncbi:glutathione S-transferase family protein [Alteromonas aestuariivivens]|uniref:Glutathione S-transferase family protein n=1 Tax=Alteromonas aestuariivivens TaxID=1938339 RepID=A0A3D8MED9_9ALTE|nr:glutathione S-transferase family protein [Alteromonas aestuariivivens]RDV28970.1 glutathione S-transferase family protein [Alteromonas aestuariivivens]
MKLFGSTTSPYVRRIRIILSQTPHEFINLQIFEGDDRDTLANRNPALKVPCLEDEGQMIFDSRVIYRYLADKFDFTTLNWEQENQLTLVDAANDSLVSLLLMKRSDYDTGEDRLFLRLQKERVEATLAALNKQVALGGFEGWDYPAICLYTLIDWVEFRQLHSLKGYDHLKAFREKHVDRIEITATDPRE